MNRAAPSAPPLARPRPSAAQLAWQREELSMFLHFGMNTFTGREWGEGSEDPSLFAPSTVDAAQWARTARETGFGSVVLTAKHHDGFCLWPTATTAHSVASSPWRNGGGDLVAEVVAACRAAGLRIGLYLSPWDRNAPCYGAGEAYDDFYVAQLTELLTGYGEVSEVWFDGANGEGPGGRVQVYDWARIHRTVRALQPEAVIFSDAGPDARWVGNEDGAAGMTCWSSVDPERVSVPGASSPWLLEALQHGDPFGSVWRPAESDVSIRPGWFWRADEDARVRTAEELMSLYSTSVGRNSKLLLNVPPTREGVIHPNDVQSLRGFAALRAEMHREDLAAGARMTSSVDGVTGRVELRLPAEAEFDVIRLEEAIEHGQHVASYRVEVEDSEGWRVLSWGTTIGNCRLHRVPVTRARAVRLCIDLAHATPRIRRLSLHRASGGDWDRPDNHAGDPDAVA